MLTIRLQRTGKKNRPDFRIVVTPKTSAVKKKFLEILGSVNPRTKQFVVKDSARVQYWLGQNISLSPTVHNLFVSNGLITVAKTKSFSIPKKPVEEVKAVEPSQTQGATAEVKAEVPEAEAVTPTSPEEVVTGPAEEVKAEAVVE
jgi:small subunit ribosomal protein S16